MQSTSPIARTAAPALYLVLGAATGCFADPGAPIGSAGGSSDGSAGASTGETTDEPTGGPTTAPTTAPVETTGETTGDETTGAMPGNCGNAQIDPGEECDNGDANNGQNGSICKGDCIRNVCGDGYLAANEGCDDANQIDDDQCSNTCKLNGCGDKVVGPGEECDDGNTVDDDACSNLCKAPFCGDANVNAGEQCDKGDSNGNDQACTLQCQLAFCGDGLVQAGVEGCDDGNQFDGDACSSMCQSPTCGDGVKQEDEACDDGNQTDGDGCSSTCQASCGDGILDPGEECDDGDLPNGDFCAATCKRTAYRVFVTSQRYAGDLGGLVGADNNCNELAMASKLGGTYLAWLSTTKESPALRFFPSTLPYVLVNGSKVADNWTDLTVGESLLAPIGTTEKGVSLLGGNPDCGNSDRVVWTHTTAKGESGPGTSCSDWTSPQGIFKGSGGVLLNIGPTWTEGCTVSCTTNARLYCFEQP